MNNFIVIEGIDGCGKTTVINALSNKIKNCYVTKEPSNSPVGIYLRQVLKEGNLSKEEMTSLFIKDRIYHKDEILEHLIKGETVLCDRYAYSTFAYQADTEEEAKKLRDTLYTPIKPDLIFFIDTHVDVCLQRIGKRDSREIFETKEKLIQVRNNYLALGDMIIIDGNNTVSNIVDQILNIYDSRNSV